MYKLCTTNNIINIYINPSLYIAKDLVNLFLDVRYQVNAVYDEDIEDYFSVMSDNDEHKAVVIGYGLLMEEKYGVKNG